MTVARSGAKVWAAVIPGALLLAASQGACSSSEAGVTPGAESGGTPAQSLSGSGNPSGNHAGGANGGGAAGATTLGGASSGGATTGGNAGASSNGGAAGQVATAGNSSGGVGPDPDDTPPWRPLNVTAGLGEHLHGSAGMDTRAKSLGKLAVDIGVNSGGYVRWLAKRGYHVMGAPCGSCPAPNLGAGRDAVGTCRLGEFDNTADHVKSTLTSLHGQFPEEDWGYFLNQDGSVRWSDVAITGMSHGATTAAVAGRVAQRMWRVVSRSGPRDTGCGNPGGICKVPLSTPSYDTACEPADIASWLDSPSKTPMNRFYGLVGTTDVECGDIMFDMHYAKYPGEPVLWNEPGAVLTSTNQFFSTEGGHLDWLLAANVPPNTEEVLNIAFGIPPENQHPAF